MFSPVFSDASSEASAEASASAAASLSPPRVVTASVVSALTLSPVLSVVSALSPQAAAPTAKKGETYGAKLRIFIVGSFPTPQRRDMFLGKSFAAHVPVQVPSRQTTTQPGRYVTKRGETQG